MLPVVIAVTGKFQASSVSMWWALDQRQPWAKLSRQQMSQTTPSNPPALPSPYSILPQAVGCPVVHSGTPHTYSLPSTVGCSPFPNFSHQSKQITLLQVPVLDTGKLSMVDSSSTNYFSQE